jgi:hypothetical protein
MTNPDTIYAQLGDLQLEAVGEDELDEHYRTTPIFAEMQAQALRPGDHSGASLPYGAAFIPAEVWAAAIEDEPEDDTGEDVVEVQRSWLVIWACLLALVGMLAYPVYLWLANA